MTEERYKDVDLLGYTKRRSEPRYHMAVKPLDLGGLGLAISLGGLWAVAS
jgi:hypothetical protein